MLHTRLYRYVGAICIAACSALLLSACGGGGGSTPSIPPGGGGGGPGGGGPGGGTTPTLYKVGGTISGLEAGNPVQLQVKVLNDVQEVSVSTNGSYVSPNVVPAGTTYSFSITAQPMWQWCTVVNGSGVVNADVTNMGVQCTAAAAKVETVPDTTDTLVYPWGVVGDGNGNLFVSDQSSHKIVKINASGTMSLYAGSSSGGYGYLDATVGTDALFFVPQGLAIDSGGNLFVADWNNDRIRSVAANGSATVATVAGSGSMGSAGGPALNAQFGWNSQAPYYLAVNPSGDVLVADYGANTIRKIALSPSNPANGTVTTVAGQFNVNTHGDGTGTASATFKGPRGIAVDAAGNSYITEYDGNTVRKMDANGVVTTLAGSLLSNTFADGTGNQAHFNQPEGIAVDSVGNLYVSDSGNSRIRRITPAGVVTTLAGSSASGIADGYGSSAKLDEPVGIYIDKQGVIWVADWGYIGHGVRKITPVNPATAQP